jgi:hypothetical protein
LEFLQIVPGPDNDAPQFEAVSPGSIEATEGCASRLVSVPYDTLLGNRVELPERIGENFRVVSQKVPDCHPTSSHFIVQFLTGPMPREPHVPARMPSDLPSDLD